MFNIVPPLSTVEYVVTLDDDSELPDFFEFSVSSFSADFSLLSYSEDDVGDYTVKVKLIASLYDSVFGDLLYTHEDFYTFLVKVTYVPPGSDISVNFAPHFDTALPIEIEVMVGQSLLYQLP